MTPETVVQIIRDALMVTFWLSAPLLAIGFIGYVNVPTGFMPKVDEGGFIMDYYTPPGTSLDDHIDALHRESGATLTRKLPTLKLYKIGVKLDMTGKTAADAKVTEAQAKQSAIGHLKPSQAVFLVVGDGDAKMILDNPNAPKDALPKDRRIPYEKDGHQLTLREALVDLAQRGDVGAGGLVELDVDGNRLAR